MPENALVIGRVVHYLAYGTPGGEHPQTCRPALVTDLSNPAKVALVVFNPTGMYFNTCEHALPDQALGGTWHWPSDHAAPSFT